MAGPGQPPARLVARDGQVRYVGGWPDAKGSHIDVSPSGYHGVSGSTEVLMTAAAAGSQGLWFVFARQRAGAAGPVQRRGSAWRGSAHGGRAEALAAFVFVELHRTLALFLMAFLALHVLTAILDPFVSIGWAATVLPFTSGYRTLAIGLGALAVDLGGAVLLTSVARGRLGFRAWRAVHWLAYLWSGGVRAFPDRRQRPGDLVGCGDGVGLRGRGGNRRARPADRQGVGATQNAAAAAGLRLPRRVTDRAGTHR